MNRNFDDFMNGIKRQSVRADYFMNYEKAEDMSDIYRNEIKTIDGYLCGKQDMKVAFDKLYDEHPEALRAIPLLLSERKTSLFVDGFDYDFKEVNFTKKMGEEFMEKTSLFKALQRTDPGSLSSGRFWQEVGLDSNAKKNRSGKANEEKVSAFVNTAAKKCGADVLEQAGIGEIEREFGVDLRALSGNGEVPKQFDYSVKSGDNVYCIETNCYNSCGSKPLEITRSYQNLDEKIRRIPNVHMIWITDGEGWKASKKNLKEAYESMEYVFNYEDLKNGALEEVFAA